MIIFEIGGHRGTFKPRRWVYPHNRNVERALREVSATLGEGGGAPDPELEHVRDVMEYFAGSIVSAPDHEVPEKDVKGRIY